MSASPHGQDNFRRSRGGITRLSAYNQSPNSQTEVDRRKLEYAAALEIQVREKQAQKQRERDLIEREERRVAEEVARGKDFGATSGQRAGGTKRSYALDIPSPSHSNQQPSPHSGLPFQPPLSPSRFARYKHNAATSPDIKHQLTVKQQAQKEFQRTLDNQVAEKHYFQSQKQQQQQALASNGGSYNSLTHAQVSQTALAYGMGYTQTGPTSAYPAPSHCPPFSSYSTFSPSLMPFNARPPMPALTQMQGGPAPSYFSPPGYSFSSSSSSPAGSPASFVPPWTTTAVGPYSTPPQMMSLGNQQSLPSPEVMRLREDLQKEQGVIKEQLKKHESLVSQLKGEIEQMRHDKQQQREKRSRLENSQPSSNTTTSAQPEWTLPQPTSAISSVSNAKYSEPASLDGGLKASSKLYLPTEGHGSLSSSFGSPLKAFSLPPYSSTSYANSSTDSPSLLPSTFESTSYLRAPQDGDQLDSLLHNFVHKKANWAGPR